MESIKYSFTIIDTPGLRNYAKNIIAGISQADAALLVVSASAGEFEASISVHGQAYEQVIVAYAMGVKQVVVAINKMDLMHAQYSETRYAECKNQLANLLNKVGQVRDLHKNDTCQIEKLSDIAYFRYKANMVRWTRG